jgi:DHA2 family multidrug resistance protein
MTDAALSPSRASAAANPWLVAVIVVVPTFMEVLDTTIAVVALRYIAGGLCRRRLMTVNGFSPAT